MARLQFVRPEVRDVLHIARNLRQHDRMELQAVHGPDLDFGDCLRVCVLASEECHVLTAPGGEPVALFGLAPVSLLGGMACPWLLGTDAFTDYPRDIVVLGKRMVQRWGRRYDQLVNYVDARNVRSLAWLQHIGFRVFAPEPWGVEGLPFHRCERCA